MTNLQYLTLFLSWLMLPKPLSSEPIPYSINTKKWSHVLDDHFISITINPTDILQGRAFGLGINSTLEILKGLSPAYIRLGSADTNKYTFRNSRYANDVVRTGDELIFTEAHWVALNEAAKAAGLDIIVCLNAAHRNEDTNKWDTRNSLELISFSESQGYNLTFQLGYEVQKTEDLSGIQFGKDLNRLRTLLNAFPRYQNSKLIGPDIKVLHKKEDIDFVNDVLIEAGPTLDAVTWHPRWPQPSKMKVSDISELGYEFPADYLDYDRTQLNKILQRSIFKNPVWIGEPKSESTGTFAEGLLWARRLMLAAKQGIEVVMKHPTLMDISHPKPEYWIALLHKKLLGKSVLDTRPLSSNHSDISVITHCTNSQYLTDKQDKPQDGSVTVYAVNMGGIDQKIQIRGTVTGKLQNIYQFVLTAGSDPDAVFSQMTYLNGEPLMMTDEGLLPELTPRIKKIERSVTLKLPAYSVGFWVIPEAKVRICQMQPVTIPTINLDTLSPANMIKNTQKGLQSIRNINEFLVEKLKNPVNSDEESYSVESGPANSIESDERGTVKEKRHSKRHRRQVSMDDIALELRKNLDDIRSIFELGRDKNTFRESNLSPEHHAHFRAAQEKIDSLTNEMSTAIRMSNQEEEFGRFLEKAGLKEDFGNLMMKEKGVGSGYPPKNIWGSGRVRREVDNEQPDSQDEENPITVGGKLNVRGLEERYKTLFSNQVQKGIRKIDEMKHKIKKEDIKIPLSVPENIQEEILLKEIEVLEKTEETMTEIMRNHKKRQEALEEIIKEEIHDIKEERLMALEEVRNHKKGRDTPKKAHHSKKNKEIKETVEETDDKTTNKRETNDDKDDGEDDEDKDGVVLIDQDYVKDRKVFGHVLAAFRYGREDLDVLGLTFRKDLYLASEQIYPQDPNAPKRPLTRLQERLMKKLGPNAYPFYFELPPHCPASVTLQPVPGDTGKPCGVDYELKAFVGDVQDDKPHKRNSVRLAIRKIMYAPSRQGEQPSVEVSKEFVMSPNKLHLEASLDKELYHHGENIAVNVHIANNSNRTVKKIKVSVRQFADICLFSTAQYKCTVAETESEAGCPVGPGFTLSKVYFIRPSLENNKDKRGLALDGQLKDEDTNLASSTIEGCPIGPGFTLSKVFTVTPLLKDNKDKCGLALDGQLKHEDTNLASTTLLVDPAQRENLGIIVQYKVKVKLCLGALGGDLTAELPFILMHPKPPEDPPSSPSPTKCKAIENNPTDPTADTNLIQLDGDGIDDNDDIIFEDFARLRLKEKGETDA